MCDDPPILNGPSFHDVSEAVARPLERPPTRGWWFFFLPSAGLLALLGIRVSRLVSAGVGVWGLDNAVGWAFDFALLLFWVGVGLAGTLISASLLLLREGSRASVQRAAEAMAICALTCAAVIAFLHFGRPSLAYWLAPAPNQMGTWPQFRSPLVWSLFAVGACGAVTALYSYVGLLPDLASLRDRSQGPRRKRFAVLALGWRGSLRHWHHHEMACRILARSAAVLSLAALAIVSTNLATSQVPGWRGALTPPHFVAAAVLSGLATIVALLVITRQALGLGHVITAEHLERLAKLLPVISLVVGFTFALELLAGWSTGGVYERFAAENRAFGPYAWASWALVACSVLAPQLLWFGKVGASPGSLLALSVLVDVGIWLERFGILVASLHRDFLPATWSRFQPTFWDMATVLGSCGLFVALYCLFVRFLPVVAAAEVKSALARAEEAR